MLEKLATVAERVAAKVGGTRRGFLGKAALSAVGVLGGLLAFPSRGLCDTDCGNGKTCEGDYGCCFAKDGTLRGCCPNAKPHLCRSSKSCHATLADAQKACGTEAVIVCGGGK